MNQRILIGSNRLRSAMKSMNTNDRIDLLHSFNRAIKSNAASVIFDDNYAIEVNNLNASIIQSFFKTQTGELKNIGVSKNLK